MSELVGIDHRADGLDPPAEHLEGQRANHLIVPVAEDRDRLAVQLVRWSFARIPTGFEPALPP